MKALSTNERWNLCSGGSPTTSRGICGKPSSAKIRSTLSCTSDFRSEEHTSELQSLMRISYAVFCLKKKKTKVQSDSNPQLSKRLHKQNTTSNTIAMYKN